MSKKKGLSLEEKRTGLQEIFFETQDFFQLKDLEKIAPKKKGIITQSVKEVLQSLVDDNLVDSDRVGTSNYFWAFPSKAGQKRKAQIAQLETSVESTKRQKLTHEEEVAKLRVGREETAERSTLLSQLAAAEAARSKLKDDLQRYRDMDPETIQTMEKEIQIAKDAINRWTDNIFTLKTYCKNRFMMEGKDFHAQFDIPEDFDYLEKL